MLGIIGAMEVEVATLKSAINNLEVTKKAGMEFCMGNIFGKDVVVVKSGQVAVDIGVAPVADDFQVDGVINTGVAGSLNNDINICDIVISTEALEHDMDVTPLGYEKSVIPDMETSVFKADKRLMEVAKKSAKEAELDVKIFEGKVVSGDQFIGTAEKKKYLRDQFGGDCAEMEGASIAHAAYLNNIPFLVIRAISDKADGGAEMDYPTFEKKAAENSIELMYKIIKNY